MQKSKPVYLWFICKLPEGGGGSGSGLFRVWERLNPAFSFDVAEIDIDSLFVFNTYMSLSTYFEIILDTAVMTTSHRTMMLLLMEQF